MSYFVRDAKKLEATNFVSEIEFANPDSRKLAEFDVAWVEKREKF